MDREEIDEVWAEYQDVVNMTAGELESWAETPCSRLASLDRAPIRRNLRLLQTPKTEWGEREVRDARRTISFVRRMSAGEQGKPVSDECPYSRRDISLMNWAFDPRKPVSKSGVIVSIESRLPAEVAAALAAFGAEPYITIWTGWVPDETAAVVALRAFEPDEPMGATLIGVGYLDGPDLLAATAAVFGLFDLFTRLHRVGRIDIDSVPGVTLLETPEGPLPSMDYLTWSFDAIEIRVSRRLIATRSFRVTRPNTR